MKRKMESRRSAVQFLTIFIALALLLLLSSSTAWAAVAGDTDGSDEIDLQDVILGLQISAGISEESGTYKNHEVSGDGKIGLEEVVYSLQVIAELRAKARIWYKDEDGDRYSDGTRIISADQPSPIFYDESLLNLVSGDPDDTNPDIIPPLADTDMDGDGYNALIDCNDNNNSIHPNADEICGDNIDQDCNGTDITCNQSITGPNRPFQFSPGQGQGGSTKPIGLIKEKIITGVPCYQWHHGCGPTALGMVMGYWDSKGFPNLIPGNAATQTTSVNQAIANSQHFNDYSLPEDYWPNLLYPDKSEYPKGDEHQDNCIADFMKTSQSIVENYYGWSWSNYIGISFKKYANFMDPSYEHITENIPFSSFSWNNLIQEIDQGRPPIFLVDTDADGQTDHFITVIGYAHSSSKKFYICLNTWDCAYHYYEYRGMNIGQYWGVFDVNTFSFTTPKNTPQVQIISPKSGSSFKEGYNIYLSGSATDVEDGQLSGNFLTWNSSRDGKLGFGSNLFISSLTPGLHTIKLIATDSDQSEGSDSISITISKKQKPVVKINTPVDGEIFKEGDAIYFNGAATDEEDGELTGNSLIWSSSKDGHIGTGSNLSKSDLSWGNHTITLTATDRDHGTGSDTITIQILETNDPEVTINTPKENQSFFEGDQIDFYGSATDPEDGQLTGDSLVWTSDLDGKIGTGTSFTANNLSKGVHTIKLTATDSDQRNGMDAISITIEEIIAPDSYIQFSAYNYSVNEDEGTAAITITRTGGTDGSVSVKYQTSDGSALSGTDYTMTTGTVTIPDGQNSGSFTVNILNYDTAPESNETLYLTLSNPSGGAALGSPATAVLTIYDDYAPPQPGQIQLSASAYSVGEAGGTINIPVTRTNGSEGSVSVVYVTSGSTAASGVDFLATSGTLAFGDGETAKNFAVTILDDAVFEGDETFTVSISSPTGGATVASPTSATVTIADDDGDTIYLQNEIVTTTETYTSSNSIWAGKEVTTQKPYGDYVIQPGGNVTLNSGTIYLKPGFTASEGSSFRATAQ